MNGSLPNSILRTLRRWWTPLACYYSVTLAAPLANGAAQRSASFTTHAVVVLLFPLLLIAGGAMCTLVTRIRRSHN